MSKKHDKTLLKIFTRPLSGNIKWRDAVGLLKELGAEIEERKGSRVAILLNGSVLHQHKPHPSPDMDKGAVDALRSFLAGHGIKPLTEERNEK